MAETNNKPKRGYRGKRRDSFHKNFGIPLAVNQLLHDITGGEAPITEDSLNKDELALLKKIAKTNLSKGKNTIEYNDYQTAGNPYSDVHGAASNKDVLSKAFDPAYNLKTTLGQASINVVGNDTIVSDQYNFNNRVADPNVGNYLESIPDQGNNIYGQMRNLGKHLGSAEGEGSKVDIRWGAPEPQNKIPTVGNTDIQGFKKGGCLPKRKFGGYIPGILQTAAGVGLSIIPGGAAAGVPLAISGVGSIAKQVGTEKAENQAAELTEQQALEAQNQEFVNNIDPNMLNRRMGGSLGIPDMGSMNMGTEISELNGGNGTPDSIKLGDIAMVDNDEVKFGDYIFSNEIEYDG